jgi:hypothetical protein
MDKKRKDRFEITEMFCAQIDGNRMYTGCIKRLRDASGNPYVFSRIVMPDGLLCASATIQDELSDNLDEMCKMNVDEELHSDAGVFTEIFRSKYFFN